MKLLLYRLSLAESGQTLFDRDIPSREDFLREKFEQQFTFPAHGGKEIRYIHTQTDKTIIAGCFAKCADALVDSDPDDPFAQTPGFQWERAPFFLNIGDDEQVIGVEHNANLGRPSSLLNYLVKHLNDSIGPKDYIIDVHSINDGGGFRDSVAKHKEKHEGGKVTKITFDMTVPNPARDSTNKTEEVLKSLKEAGVSSVSETMSSSSELDIDSDEIRDREEYTQKGGGDFRVKDGGKIIYNSKERERRVEVDDDLRPDGKEKKGLLRKLLNKLVK